MLMKLFERSIQVSAPSSATIAAAVAAVAGAVCLIVRYKDELAELCGKIARKVSRPAEYDDFADVDEIED